MKSVKKLARTNQRVMRLVLPAFNEAKNLGPLLERTSEVMGEDGVDFEVVLVDDGSKDGTPLVAKKYQKTIPIRVVVHEKNEGLGATIRDGLLAALAVSNDDDIIVAMDADNTHTPALVHTMIRKIREGNDVVIASRFQYGSYVRGVPAFRKLLSWAASFLFRLTFPIPSVRDYTCGYRAYRAGILRKAFDTYGERFINQDGFECMVDILLKLRTMDPIMREVPLILRYDKKQGSSKMRVLRTVYRSLRLIVVRKLGW